ncbi:unnamed protein product [Ambrosiozyma monospora]|uniref:Unnamed protein product n=1 Tax=Ambrosiozyma monospora TaxID=43982 RepID=A0A9W6YUX4_AMBMO|nr:unnamed protein product [Ambrosiozyma monospora]
MTATPSTSGNSLPSLTSSATVSSYSAGVPPSDIKNPFLLTSKFKQGTFYVIVLPIIGFFFLAYLLSVAFTRWRSRRQARQASLRDEFDDEKSIGGGYDEASLLFKGTNSTATEFTNEHKVGAAASSSSFLSKLAGGSVLKPPGANPDHRLSTQELSMLQNQQARNSSASLDLMKDDPTFYHGVYQNDLTQFNDIGPSQLHTTHKYAGSIAGQSVLHLNSQNEYAPSMTTGNPSGAGITPSIVLPEPTKAKTQQVLNVPNSKTHFHKKTLSSYILDEFISTGELPTEVKSNNNSSTNLPHVTNTEDRHSMYQTTNDSYSSFRESRRSRTSSPVRGQSSPSRSPVRRNDSRSPVRPIYYQQQPPSPSK